MSGMFSARQLQQDIHWDVWKVRDMSGMFSARALQSRHRRLGRLEGEGHEPDVRRRDDFNQDIGVGTSRTWGHELDVRGATASIKTSAMGRLEGEHMAGCSRATASIKTSVIGTSPTAST